MHSAILEYVSKLSNLEKRKTTKYPFLVGFIPFTDETELR